MGNRDLVRLFEVTIGVPDPSATATFIERGLDMRRGVRSGATNVTTLSANDGSTLALTESGVLGVEQIALEFADSADPTALLDRLELAGVPYTREEGGAGIVFRDPSGLSVSCREPAAERPPAVESPNSERSEGHIDRLGHINLQVPDAPRAATFWTDVVGLALSERAGEVLYFLRAGSEHHAMGIRGGADHATIHHVALEVPGWEAYPDICDHLADLGHPVEYGPGRHGPGNSFFLYIREPSSGLRMELFADMAHIHDDDTYSPPVWDPDDRTRTNRWGPAPPESFTR